MSVLTHWCNATNWPQDDALAGPGMGSPSPRCPHNAAHHGWAWRCRREDWRGGRRLGAPLRNPLQGGTARKRARGVPRKRRSNARCADYAATRSGRWCANGSRIEMPERTTSQNGNARIAAHCWFADPAWQVGGSRPATKRPALGRGPCITCRAAPTPRTELVTPGCVYRGCGRDSCDRRSRRRSPACADREKS